MPIQHWNLIVDDDTESVVLFKRKHLYEDKMVWGLLGGDLQQPKYDNLPQMCNEVIKHGASHIVFPNIDSNASINIKLIDYFMEENFYLFFTTINVPFILNSDTFMEATVCSLKNIKKLDLAPEAQAVFKNYSSHNDFLRSKIPTIH